MSVCQVLPLVAGDVSGLGRFTDSDDVQDRIACLSGWPAAFCCCARSHEGHQDSDLFPTAHKDTADTAAPDLLREAKHLR
ncbi:MAG: hypothetical protein C4346_19150 [Chloroflexota bacterium]